MSRRRGNHTPVDMRIPAPLYWPGSTRRQFSIPPFFRGRIMLSAERNEVLTRFGAGTPMGELLRRYWYPVALSAELTRESLRRVRLLGEDLVLYRLSDGSAHLLADRCPHRGVALSYGMLEHEGVRC